MRPKSPPGKAPPAPFSSPGVAVPPAKLFRFVICIFSRVGRFRFAENAFSSPYVHRTRVGEHKTKQFVPLKGEFFRKYPHSTAFAKARRAKDDSPRRKPSGSIVPDRPAPERGVRSKLAISKISRIFISGGKDTRPPLLSIRFVICAFCLAPSVFRFAKNAFSSPYIHQSGPSLPHRVTHKRNHNDNQADHDPRHEARGVSCNGWVLLR